jgi:hypothetical protein
MGVVLYTDGGRILTERGQNEDCIECLERLLQKTKDGEICGVAIAIQYTDRSNAETTAGFLWNRSVIGSLHYLMRNIGKD